VLNEKNVFYSVGHYDMRVKVIFLQVDSFDTALRIVELAVDEMLVSRQHCI